MSDEDSEGGHRVYQQVDWIGPGSETIRFRAVCDHCGHEGVCAVPSSGGGGQRQWYGFSLVADGGGAEHPECPGCQGHSINVTHEIPGPAPESDV